MTTSLNPTKENISEIEQWLSKELNDEKIGFYTNWEMIYEAYQEKRLSILKKNNEAIAFSVFRIYDEMAVIDIAEIRPDERRKGNARKFIIDTLNYLNSQGVVVVQLYCSPENSVYFWEKCGFKRYETPNDLFINMYITLIDVLNPIQISEKSQTDILKLWDCEPHLADRNEPKWIWELDYKDDNKTLVKPIIFPAFNEWQIQLELKDQIVSHKVKHLPIEISDNGIFMVLKEIIKKKDFELYLIS